MQFATTCWDKLSILYPVIRGWSCLDKNTCCMKWFYCLVHVLSQFVEYGILMFSHWKLEMEGGVWHCNRFNPGSDIWGILQLLMYIIHYNFFHYNLFLEKLFQSISKCQNSSPCSPVPLSFCFDVSLRR